MYTKQLLGSSVHLGLSGDAEGLAVLASEAGIGMLHVSRHPQGSSKPMCLY